MEAEGQGRAGHLEGELGQGEAGQVGGGQGQLGHCRLPGAAVQGRGGGLQGGHLHKIKLENIHGVPCWKCTKLRR